MYINVYKCTSVLLEHIKTEKSKSFVVDIYCTTYIITVVNMLGTRSEKFHFVPKEQSKLKEFFGLLKPFNFKRWTVYFRNAKYLLDSFLNFILYF